MKTKTLSVVDVPENLGPELRALFDKVASRAPASMMRCRDVNGVKRALLLHDWRNVAVRYIRRFGARINPRIWVYRGGTHVAIHVAREERRDARGYTRPGPIAEPDHCLGRIIEA